MDPVPATFVGVSDGASWVHSSAQPLSSHSLDPLEVHDHRGKYEQEEYDRNGARYTRVNTTGEAIVIDLHRQGGSCVDGGTGRHIQDNVEDLEHVDDHGDENDGEDGSQHWDGNSPKDLPLLRAIYSGGFEDLAVQRREPGPDKQDVYKRQA